MRPKPSPEEMALSVLKKPNCRKTFNYLMKNGVKFYSEIKEAMEFNNGTLNYTLDCLHHAGLIVYETHENDNRKYVRVSGDAKVWLKKREAAKKSGQKFKKGQIHATLSVQEYLDAAPE